MTTINREKLRRLMYEWHSGQGSSLYAAASSGLVRDRAELAAELRQCAMLAMHPDHTPFKRHDSRQAIGEADFLSRAADAVESYLCGAAIVHPTDRRVYWPLPWAVVPAGASLAEVVIK